jgi:RHS repeat-associated protein
MPFEWQNGRELKSIGGANYISYDYDYAGLRTKKHITGTDTYYFYEGNKLLAEKTGQSLKWFYYDATGVYGFQYNGVDYVFEKNILGDVTAVWTTNGVKVGEYIYDAWGYPLSMKDAAGNEINQYADHVLVHNPFRYRGYYFDKETYFYYLNSRYYDPQYGRFINADEPSMLYETGGISGGANLYAYCLNNPIMYTDSTGYGPIGDYFSGVWDGIKATAVGLYNAVIHIDQTVMSIINNPLGALAAVGLGIWNISTPGIIYNLVTAESFYAAGYMLGGVTADALLIAASYGVGAALGAGTKALGAGAKAIGKLSPKKYIQLDSSLTYNAAKAKYWRSQGSLNGKARMGADGKSMVLHHPFGRQGANLYKVTVMTATKHISFHKTSGYYFYNGIWNKGRMR